MLISLVVQLRPRQAGSLPGTTGPAVHGAFFKWLAGVDGALATELHDTVGPKPFTVSGIQHGTGEVEISAKRSAMILSPTDIYWFRITSMDMRLSEVLMERLYQRPPATLDILGQSFKIERVAASYKEHSWGATTSWKELVDYAQLNATDSSKPEKLKIKLFFHSPTTFKLAGGRAMPIPLPENVFNSLLSRWNTFSQLTLDPSSFAEPSEKLAISGYDLQTELAMMENSSRGAKLLAFRGWCEYTLFDSSLEWRRVLHLLSRFVFYSGLGYKTTMGFGQVLTAKI